MLLRLQAADPDAARHAALRQLEERGLKLRLEDVSVREVSASGGLRRLFRRTQTFEVEVNREALAAFRPPLVHRVAQELGARMNGSAGVRVADDGIFIRVFPPCGEGGVAVQPRQVLRLLAEKEIQDVDEEAVMEAVREAKGEWVRVAERRPELDRDAQIEVAIAPDGMEASVTLRPPLGGAPADAERIRAALAEAGVKYGVDDAAVASLVSNPPYGEPVVVAKGSPPQPGQDGWLELFLPELSLRPTIKEDGTVDYREIHVAHAVREGEQVGRLHPPTLGVEGRNVAGEVLPASAGKEARLKLGKGIRLDEETGILYALRDGNVIQGEILDVAPVYQVPGNVDFSVGNIRFPGAVHVAGDVTEGFIVEAEGSVLVRGSVVGATVISHGGDIEVRQGIRGPGEVRVEAPKGTVRAKFVENATVKGLRVEVKDAILHSQVMAEESIVVTGRDSRIAGGRLEAGHLIEGALVGSIHATRTELRIRGPRRSEGAPEPPTGSVRVRQVCHPGTVIVINGTQYVVREELSRVRFRWEDGAVRPGVF